MTDNVSTRDLLRVNVVGVCGAGKSWFARQLAETLNSSMIELDSLHWGPNWKESDTATMRRNLEQAMQGNDRWIMDGNYHDKTHDIKWREATMVIWVDTSFIRSVLQVTTRAIRRAWTQEELWPGTGNRETFRGTFFSTDSIVVWTIRTFHAIRRRYELVERDSSTRAFRFVRLRGPREIRDFLNNVANLRRSADETV